MGNYQQNHRDAPKKKISKSMADRIHVEILDETLPKTKLKQENYYCRQ